MKPLIPQTVFIPNGKKDEVNFSVGVDIKENQYILTKEELIELADGLINGRSAEFQQFEEKLTNYKNKYQ